MQYLKSNVWATVADEDGEIVVTFSEDKSGSPQIDDHIYGNSDFDDDLDDLELEEVQESTFVSSDSDMTVDDMKTSLRNRAFNIVGEVSIHPPKSTTKVTVKSKPKAAEIEESEIAVAKGMKITGKITPMLERKSLEIYGKALVYIPLSDEERKIFVPNWNNASSPAWELSVEDYESDRPKDENE